MSRGQQQFSEDQLAEFQEAFLLYDNRGDGKISVSYIGDVMRALGQNPTESGEWLYCRAQGRILMLLTSLVDSKFTLTPYMIQGSSYSIVLMFTLFKFTAQPFSFLFQIYFRGEEVGSRAPGGRPRVLRDVPADPGGDNGAPLHRHHRRLHRGTPPL